MSKPGRNDPCPCGSGRKYKRCCLAIKSQAAVQQARERAERQRREAEERRKWHERWRRERRPPSPPTEVVFDEPMIQVGPDAFMGPLELLSNSVVDLIDEQRFDEALEACERLRNEYPDMPDWLDRSAMVYEATGDYGRAADFYRRMYEYTLREDQYDGFDEEARQEYLDRMNDMLARARNQSG